MIDLTTFKYETLKQLNIEELTELASQIRQNILANVSKMGGHLSSNLGVVEVTIALHYCFDFPHDQLLFDVAHQTYAHKLLTGRSLENLRKQGGVSGFSRFSESPFDQFEGGHSGGAIGYGLGLLKAKELGSDIGEIIAFVGDASLANGNSLESLNLLGANYFGKMIIIVNDNDMSISKNVGALAKKLNKMRSGRFYNALKKVPVIRSIARPIARNLKYRYYRNHFFTSLGFNYIENVDGHNLKELINYFNYAKKQDRSIVIHIKTQKGRGYEPSEHDLVGDWHSVAPFDLKNGILNDDKEKTVSYHVGLKLDELMANDDKIVVITPAMMHSCQLDIIKEKYPKRFIDTGIAEASAIYYASSLSRQGYHPVVITYANFITRALDEILNEIAREHLPLTILLDHAGIVEGDGDTHQGLYDAGMLLSIPTTHLYEPDSIKSASNILTDAIKSNEISIIRYPKRLPMELGSSKPFNCLIKNNNQTLIITRSVRSCEVFDYLTKNKLAFDLLSVTNLDKTILNSYFKQLNYSKLIIIEDVSSMGSLVKMIDLSHFKEGKVYNFGDHFMPVATNEEMKSLYKVDLPTIFKEGEHND